MRQNREETKNSSKKERMQQEVIPKVCVWGVGGGKRMERKS